MQLWCNSLCSGCMAPAAGSPSVLQQLAALVRQLKCCEPAFIFLRAPSCALIMCDPGMKHAAVCHSQVRTVCMKRCRQGTLLPLHLGKSLKLLLELLLVASPHYVEVGARAAPVPQQCSSGAGCNCTSETTAAVLHDYRLQLTCCMTPTEGGMVQIGFAVWPTGCAQCCISVGLGKGHERMMTCGERRASDQTPTASFVVCMLFITTSLASRMRTHDLRSFRSDVSGCSLVR